MTEQTLPMGPAASQIAIKQLGTNGGGFFNVNSAHPFENPTPLSNFLEMLAILLIPAALCYTFGVMVGDRRQGWAILAAMLVIFVPLTIGCIAAEQAAAGSPNGRRRKLGIASRRGNMEGKETRFGIANSGTLGDRDDGRLQRQRQLDARFVHAAGRAGADVADAARRSRSSAASAAGSTAC